MSRTSRDRREMKTKLIERQEPLNLRIISETIAKKIARGEIKL